MSASTVRVSVKPGAKTVDPRTGLIVQHESATLQGAADTIGEIASVKLDDGREVLIARQDLEVLP